MLENSNPEDENRLPWKKAAWLAVIGAIVAVVAIFAFHIEIEGAGILLGLCTCIPPAYLVAPLPWKNAFWVAVVGAIIAGLLTLLFGWLVSGLGLGGFVLIFLPFYVLGDFIVIPIVMFRKHGFRPLLIYAFFSGCSLESKQPLGRDTISRIVDLTLNSRLISRNRKTWSRIFSSIR